MRENLQNQLPFESSYLVIAAKYFGKLNISAGDKMGLPFQLYSWYEAVDQEDIRNGTNHSLKRYTADVLLCGPTALTQVKARVGDNNKILHIEIDLPHTFCNERRTAVRLTDASQLARGVGPAAVGEAIKPCDHG